MHDQKFGTFYSLRPEDGLYGSNEPKKCEIRPVVSSIVHFKVFKSYFIYIIDIDMHNQLFLINQLAFLYYSSNLKNISLGIFFFCFN